MSGEGTVRVSLSVNGVPHELDLPPRRLLSDALRHDLRLTGTHVGCEHGVCGACTVLVDGWSARACLLLAVQCEGASVTTIEGLTPAEGLSPLQEAFRATHGLQCGFCTPGMIMQSIALLAENPHPSEHEIREGLEGNICRCTGYQNIVKSVLFAAQTMSQLPQGAASKEGANA